MLAAIITLGAALTALNITDVITTVLILRKGGRELNPVMRKVMEKLGVIKALVAMKAIFLAMVAGLAYLSWVADSSVIYWTLLALIAIYAGVCVNNVAVLKRLK